MGNERERKLPYSGLAWALQGREKGRAPQRSGFEGFSNARGLQSSSLQPPCRLTPSMKPTREALLFTSSCTAAHRSSTLFGIALQAAAPCLLDGTSHQHGL